jgi:hypothetical protein
MNSWKASRPPAWDLRQSALRDFLPLFRIDQDSPSVEDVHERNGEDVGLLGTSEVRDVGVQRNTLTKLASFTLLRMSSQDLLTFSAAPALATAKLTPRIALAPSLVLLGVPSSSLRKASILVWSLTSMASLIRAGAMTELTFSTALVTPLPPHLDLSPSRSSQASCWPISLGYNLTGKHVPREGRDEPVEAPEGTMARCRPVSVTRSTSTVGLPRES